MNAEEPAGPLAALACGAAAGLAVDVTLFPIDTLKTRAQALLSGAPAAQVKQVKLYAGIVPTLVASAPSAALFFTVYESVRRRFAMDNNEGTLMAASAVNAGAAACGEAAACTLRVPQEILKQRLQAGTHGSTREAISTYYTQITRSGKTRRGFLKRVRTMYTGFGITLMREIPFSAIQFPLFETLKYKWKCYMNRNNTRGEDEVQHLTGLQSAICGSISGAVAASLTTPLDVLKTQVMVAGEPVRPSLVSIAKRIAREHGIKGFFAGIGPRVTWISIGGFIFLGTFDTLKTLTASI